MAKRYYNLEKETKEYLKTCGDKGFSTPNNIKIVNDYPLIKKTQNKTVGFLKTNPVILDNLVLWLDAGISESYPSGGPSVSDLSLNNRNASLSNGTAFNTSGTRSFVFDGVNDTIRMSTTGIVTDEITIEVWANQNTLAKTYCGIIGSSGTEKYEMLAKSGGNFEVSLASGNWTQYPYTTITANTWIHLAVAAKSLVPWRFSKNATNISHTAIGGNYTVNGSSITYLDIGQIRNNATFAYSGSIASVRIYNRALTNAEISQNYNATKWRFGL